jgi:hypothetical protein
MITQSDDDILFLNACLIRGSILFDGNNFNAGFLREAELSSLQARNRDRPAMETKVAPDDPAMFHELGQDILRHVNGNGEANPLSRLNNGRVDADHLPPAVDEWAAAVAWIQGGIGLNDIVDKVARDAPQGSAQGADDTGRHRRFKSVRTANRHDQLTDTQLGRITQNGMRYLAGVGLHDGQVRPGIIADDATIDLLAVAKADTNMLVAPDDVMIGQKEPIGREEDARSAAAAPALPATQVHDRGPQHFRHVNDDIGIGIQGLTFSIL